MKTRQIFYDAIIQGMPVWEYVFRHGLAPVLGKERMRRLRQALLDNDPRLIHGRTTSFDTNLLDQTDLGMDQIPARGGCALTYSYLQEEPTLAKAEAKFLDVCTAVNARLQELGVQVCWHGSRLDVEAHDFISWFDDAERSQVYRELLRVLDDVLAG